MKAIERNVADAGVYQHFYHIATRRLFFPQEICSISYQLSASESRKSYLYLTADGSSYAKCSLAKYSSDCISCKRLMQRLNSKLRLPWV